MVKGVGGTRFKGLIMEAVEPGRLGQWAPTQALPEEKACLLPFCSLGRKWDGDISILPPSLCRAPGLCRPDWAIPARLPSKTAVRLPPSLLALFISRSKEPRVFLGVGGDGAFAVRMLMGGSTGTLWPPSSPDP